MPVCIISLQIRHVLVSNYNVKISQVSIFPFSFLFRWLLCAFSLCPRPTHHIVQSIRIGWKANLNGSNRTNAKPINFDCDICARIRQILPLLPHSIDCIYSVDGPTELFHFWYRSLRFPIKHCGNALSWAEVNPNGYIENEFVTNSFTLNQ